MSPARRSTPLLRGSHDRRSGVAALALI